MRTVSFFTLALAFIPTPPPAAAEAGGGTVAEQRAAAEANCRTVPLAPLAKAESANFLVYGASGDAQLKGLAATLERQYSVAVKALQFEKGNKPWTGKLTVYVFDDRGQFRSIARQMEKRSPDETEQSSMAVTGEFPHLAVGPGPSKEAASAETQAGYDLAIAVLSARANGTALPEWLTQGFARATAAHAASISAGMRKRAGRRLTARSKPSDACNDRIDIERRLPLAACVADYHFYGNGLSRPGGFLLAFRPGDEKPTKTTADALEAVKLTPDRFESGYLDWLRGNH